MRFNLSGVRLSYQDLSRIAWLAFPVDLWVGNRVCIIVSRHHCFSPLFNFEIISVCFLAREHLQILPSVVGVAGWPWVREYRILIVSPFVELFE